jgi:hypothetical protein
MDLYTKNRNPANFEPEDNAYTEEPGEVLQDMKVGHGYWLNICKRLDTLHKDLCPGCDERGFYSPRFDKEKIGRVFSSVAVSGNHLWHDKFTSGNFVSEELAKRLQDAGVTGLFYQHFKQV